MTESIPRPSVAVSKTEVTGWPAAICSSLETQLTSYRKDEKGTIAIIFALSVFVVFGLIGGAVDFGRAMTVRDQMQNAVDASVLAAARVWQTENDLVLAEQKALQYFESNKPQGVSSSVTSFTSDPVRNSIVMEATASIPAPFLTAAADSLVRNDYVPLNLLEVNARSEALLAVGGNAETNLEISMMLDVTGSMSGDKIEDLKLAAKDLIDIVVWSDQSEYTSKVALVPFANAINLADPALVNQVRGNLRTGSTTCTSSSQGCTYTTSTSPSSSQWTWGLPAMWNRFVDTDGSTRRYRASSVCVTERIGNDRYTDAAPDSNARKVGPLYYDVATNSSAEQTNCGNLYQTSDAEINAVLPLTSDKTELKQRIDKLKLAGATAGQLGTAWAWYMLSPNWGYLWPSENRPVAYHTAKTNKIAILMTDGEYNTAHCNGVLSSNSSANGRKRINCNANNANSDSQADALCTAMKNGTGITVYTVGFALGGNNTAINTLKACASDETKFYEAEDGQALRLAFRDIALQIAKLRLSQ